MRAGVVALSIVACASHRTNQPPFHSMSVASPVLGMVAPGPLVASGGSMLFDHATPSNLSAFEHQEPLWVEDEDSAGKHHLAEPELRPLVWSAVAAGGDRYAVLGHSASSATVEVLSLGLKSVWSAVGPASWRDLAIDRIGDVFVTFVDSDGLEKCVVEKLSASGRYQWIGSSSVLVDHAECGGLVLHEDSAFIASTVTQRGVDPRWSLETIDLGDAAHSGVSVQGNIQGVSGPIRVTGLSVDRFDGSWLIGQAGDGVSQHAWIVKVDDSKSSFWTHAIEADTDATSVFFEAIAIAPDGNAVVVGHEDVLGPRPIPGEQGFRATSRKARVWRFGPTGELVDSKTLDHGKLSAARSVIVTRGGQVLVGGETMDGDKVSGWIDVL